MGSSPSNAPCPECDFEVRLGSSSCPECETSLLPLAASPSWRRAFAFGVDLVLLLATVGPLHWFLVSFLKLPRLAPNARGLDAVLQFFATDIERLIQQLAPFLLLTALYFILFLSLNGRTIGHQLLRLRLVNTRGEVPSVVGTSLRTFAFLLFFPLGSIWALFDREHRAFHEHLSGTYLVRDQ